MRCAWMVMVGVWWSVATLGQPVEGVLRSRPSPKGFTMADGLSQSSVVAIAQDVHGFLWFGTRDGLNRFDSRSFAVFRPVMGDSLSLPHAQINALAADSAGHLWIATPAGLAAYHDDWGHFRHFPIGRDDIRDEAHALLPWRGMVWVGTKDGLFLFDPASDRFAQPDHIPLAKAVGKEFVKAVMEDSRGGIWVGTTDGLFYAASPEEEVALFAPWQPGAQFLSHDRVEALCEDSLGRIWVGTYGGGVNLLRPGIGYLAHLTDTSSGARLNSPMVRALVRAGGYIWVGTMRGAALLEEGLLPGGQGFAVQAAAGQSVRALQADRKGAVWMGTYHDGVQLFDPERQHIQHYEYYPENLKERARRVVNAFFQDTAGSLYAATEHDGLCQWSAEQQQLERCEARGAVSAPERTKSLAGDGLGGVWVGSFRQGLFHFDPAQQAFARFPEPGAEQFGELREAIVNDLLLGRDGNLWVATDKFGGLHCFAPEEGAYVDYPMRDSLQSLLRYVQVKALMQDQLGNIWLGTNGLGLLIFHPETQSLLHYQAGMPGVALSSDVVSGLAQDGQGAVWIATRGGGLNRFDRSRAQFEVFTTAHGLVNNQLEGLCIGQEGYVWAISPNGISCFDPQQHCAKGFRVGQELPVQEYNGSSWTYRPDGRYLFGSHNGMIAFEQDALSPSAYSPPLLITGFYLDNQSVAPGVSAVTPLARHILNTQKITLSHRQSTFAVSFLSLDYHRPGQGSYRYRLRGLNDEWQMAGSSLTVSFPHLEAGDYTFEVQQADQGGLWRGKALQIRILPPFWMSNWAIAAYALAILIGLWVVRYLMRQRARMLRELAAQEQVNRQLEEDHRLKLNAFAELAHELRTPLTLVINPLEQLIRRMAEPEALQQLRTMHLSAKRMVRLVNQILEAGALAAGQAKVESAPVNLPSLMQQVCASFQDQAQMQGVDLQCQVTLPAQTWVRTDWDKLEKILSNLLSNAIKFNREGGWVRATLSGSSSGQLLQAKLEVSDNGQGIPEALQSRVFEEFFRYQSANGTGIGLSLAQKLTQLLGGQLQLLSQPGQGTTFTIHLPLDLAAPQLKPTPSKTSPLPQPKKADLRPLLLIADDDPDLRRYLESRLAPDYRTATAQNGHQALAKALAQKPALIITDGAMPDTGGAALCEQVRQNPVLAHLPIIMLSARDSGQDRIDALNAGADLFMPKPFPIEELMTNIQSLLKNRERLRQSLQTEGSTTPAEAQPTTLSSYDAQLLKRIRKAVEAQLASPELTVDALGSTVGLSRVHLYRKLKSLTGLSPSEYIKKTRLQTAANLLLAQQGNVTEVAMQVGFQDLHYFSKVFKKAFGLSPSAYLKQHQTTQDASAEAES